VNYLYYGDNLTVLREHVEDETVDLVYLDPPFNSNQDYNVLFAEQSGEKSAAQIKAFEDTWRWDIASAAVYEEVVEKGGRVSVALQGLRAFLRTSDMMAYLTMMAPRLTELRRVLKPTGSLYLHCDPTASHYLKILLDSVFGPERFMNEIIWRRTGAHAPPKSFGPVHDSILVYTKTSDYFFRVVRVPYMKGHVERRYTRDATGKYKFTSGGNVLTGAGVRHGESGAKWRGFDPSAENRHWAIPGFLAEQMPPEFQGLGVSAKLEALYKAGLVEIAPKTAWPTPLRYLKPTDGNPLSDIWAYQPYTEGLVFGSEEGIDHDVAWLGPTDPERLGYPTQKPEGLLARIIQTSCPDGGTVLDPFCGCGTTIIAGEMLKRPWIGIDITHLAMTLIRHRLGSAATYKVIGEPVSLPDAQALANQDKYQFQWWALGRVGARPTPTEQKKGADHGIDGRLYFHDEPAGGKTKQIILSVKGGSTSVKDVRDLRGVIEREKAQLGVLLTMEEPTKPMHTEAASAGFYDSPGFKKKYPRLQILTIAELLEGKKIEYPQTNVTFKQAPKAKGKTTEQMYL
jgi:DNA modification methylase